MLINVNAVVHMQKILERCVKNASSGSDFLKNDGYRLAPLVWNIKSIVNRYNHLPFYFVYSI
ncbi:hypothetical protein [Peribacillus simplex]|nr:hypothetical protein [Peribacillus simplex]